MKKEIEYVEYFITKAKSFHAKIKIPGQGTVDNCIQSMRSTERKICSQLINIATTAIHLTNSSLPAGPSVDTLARVLIQFYVCLANLTKHLIMRHSTLTVSYQGIK